MVEPEKKDNPADLEDTVRNLREQNAKLIQLIRSQGLSLDPPTESSNITFDNSDINLTTNSVNTNNQITHQHVHNNGPINQQNYSGQIIHGNQSNITPNFNTVIQTASQPFVQNNSNTLVQNNTNLIQPINLVNFNNVSLDSLQSFFASQNNLVYLSQTSSSSTTTTTTTTTTSNINLNNESEQQHQISIRPKPSIASQAQDVPPLLSKVKTEHYDNLPRQLSTSSNSETTNLLDNDSSHKQPRPIRPKPSSRSNSLQVYTPVVLNETKPSNPNVLTTSSLINNTTPSSTVSLLSPSTSFEEHHHVDLSPQLSIPSKSMDLTIPPTNNLFAAPAKPTKNPQRNRKKTPQSSSINPPNNATLIPIAPNPGRPLAPAPLNVQRIVTTNNKRATTSKKRTSKTLVQYHSESILPQSSSPPNSFAESISGLMQNFDQELMASNFLSQPPPTTNILSNDSSNINLVRTLDNINVRQIVNTSIQRHDSAYQSMPTLDEFNDRLEHETHATNIQDYNVDNEQITSFINEDEMNFVEMNFDENTFLKQFDLDDVGMKLNIHPEQNIFASLLTSNPMESSNVPLPPPLPPPSHPHIYPGSSLINNNVFTTIVPLGSQRPSSLLSSISRRLPEEGVQLTARHIEPSQVATYESGKYQDILDDLVTVTDQDVLSHVQAAAAVSDPTVFTFSLLEATNEIMKAASPSPPPPPPPPPSLTTTITQNIGAEETASSFVDLQYFYPIEQEQEFLQKQLEECDEKDENEEDEEEDDEEEEEEKEPQPPVVLEKKVPKKILPSVDSPKSEDHPAITDLTSILQINQTHASSPIRETTLPIDYDSLLLPPPPPPPALPPPTPPQPPLPPPPLSLEFPTTYEKTSRKACIIFEPILSPKNSPSPVKPSEDEMVLDSGCCLTSSSVEKPNSFNCDQIEDLLNESYVPPKQTPPSSSPPLDNTEPLDDEPTEKVLEKNFYHYQKIYNEHLQKPPTEQHSPIPSVKLKLKSIHFNEKKKRKLSPSPVPPSEAPRPPLKIKIRTKLPDLPKEEEPPLPKLKIRKPVKKPKTKKKISPSPPSIDEQLDREAKLSLKTEYAGLTRFEQPLAQLYHQPSLSDTHIPPTPGENEDLMALSNQQDLSSIKETPYISTSPVNQKKKFLHLTNYDDEPLNNNTYITPPPETDFNIPQHQQYKATTNDFHPSPKKFKRKSTKESYPSSSRKSQLLPPPLPPPPLPPPGPSQSQSGASSMHMHPYSQPYHHFDPRAPPFFNFPFSNPFVNAPSTSPHFHPNSIKYHYPTHQQQFSYHPHMQQQYHNNSNYMSSHDPHHHPFNR